MLLDNINFKLALSHTPQLNISTYDKLVNQYSAIDDIVKQSNAELIQQGLTDASIATLKEYQRRQDQSTIGRLITEDLQWLDEYHNQYIIFFHDKQYPVLLKEISNPPLKLYVKGNPDSLTFPQLAMVGSRQASLHGQELAMQFAKELSQIQLTITSGMALGIDGASHRGALLNGGNTIAVMGTGIIQVYPKSHIELANKISQQGALVSEFPLFAPPRAHHFPQRNRIISGLSLGVLVIEAGLRSGSLITAKYALEQNRDVFAVPSSIQNPLSKGCHQLLRQGAKLVETVDDILEEIKSLCQLQLSQLAPARETNKNYTCKNDSALSGIEKKIITAISHDPVTIDTLTEYLQLPVNQITSALQRLALKGLIELLTNGMVVKV